MNASHFYSIHTQKGLLLFDSPKVMGILNVSPDSFFDGGKYCQLAQSLTHIQEMIDEGMDILDIGGVSTRPGSEEVEMEEEWLRIKDVLLACATHFPTLLISIDTFHAEIARRAYEYGADIINDISGGQFDEKMFETVGKLKMPYILMHTQNRPQNMQNNPNYTNICLDLMHYFSTQMDTAKKAGITDIILDLGFGFGKTMAHNYELLNKMDFFKLLNAPMLVGISRKSMLWKLLECTPEEALNATTCVHTLALLNGAHILRVHDVKQAKECIKITEYYKTRD
ncbi:MAG: dihydropteroate synthase [Bacteroidales bacterium]